MQSVLLYTVLYIYIYIYIYKTFAMATVEVISFCRLCNAVSGWRKGRLCEKSVRRRGELEESVVSLSGIGPRLCHSLTGRKEGIRESLGVGLPAGLSSLSCPPYRRHGRWRSEFTDSSLAVASWRSLVGGR